MTELEKVTSVNPELSSKPLYSGFRDPDSSRQFRQEVEREYRAEMRQLREESNQKEILIMELKSELLQLKHEFEHDRKTNARALEAAMIMAEASSTAKKGMAILIAVLMLIGGFASSYEYVKRYFGQP